MSDSLISLFNWQKVQQWAELQLEKCHPANHRALLQEIVQICAGKRPVADHPADVEPLPVLDWLLLSDEELLSQVRYSLHHPPRLEEQQDALSVLPACAMVACREYHLPLAADLLRLMLHLNLKTGVVHEVAEFLAFQQKPDGSCGFINPLKPTPFEAGQGFAEFHLPATHAIVRALQGHLEHHPPTEEHRPWTFELNT